MEMPNAKGTNPGEIPHRAWEKEGSVPAGIDLALGHVAAAVRRQGLPSRSGDFPDPVSHRATEITEVRQIDLRTPGASPGIRDFALPSRLKSPSAKGPNPGEIPDRRWEARDSVTAEIYLAFGRLGFGIPRPPCA